MIQETADRLGLALKKHADRLDADLGSMLEYTARTLHEMIYKATPVDTGLAQNSWGMSIDSPKDGVVGSPEGSPMDLVDSINVAYMDNPSPIWIWNNVPYIVMLEFGLYVPGNGPKTIGGFSTQAPQGMVRVSIASLQQQLEALSSEVVSGLGTRPGTIGMAATY